MAMIDESKSQKKLKPPEGFCAFCMKVNNNKLTNLKSKKELKDNP